MSDSVYQSYQTLVQDTTIHNVTLLSTDYLNHFNEVVMLLEIVPDMPEMFEDVKEWQPKTYQEHFRDSLFTSRDLAVEAYEFSPPEFREPFDQLIEQLNAMVVGAIEPIDAVIATGDAERMALTVAEITMALRTRIDRAGAIINGSAERVDQEGVDAIFDDSPADQAVAGPDTPAVLQSCRSAGNVFPAEQADLDVPLDVALAFLRCVAEVLGGTAERRCACPCRNNIKFYQKAVLIK